MGARVDGAARAREQKATAERRPDLRAVDWDTEFASARNLTALIESNANDDEHAGSKVGEHLVVALHLGAVARGLLQRIERRESVEARESGVSEQTECQAGLWGGERL